MIKELVKPEHQLFHHRIDSCSYNLDRHEMSKILIENMLHYNGVGLSANQIGIWERVFCMIRDIEHNEIIVCFNPKIVKSYDESIRYGTGEEKYNYICPRFWCSTLAAQTACKSQILRRY